MIHTDTPTISNIIAALQYIAFNTEKGLETPISVHSCKSCRLSLSEWTTASGEKLEYISIVGYSR